MRKMIKGYKYSIYKNGKVYSHIINQTVRPRLKNGEKYVKLAKDGRYKWHKVSDLIRQTFGETA